MQAHTEKPKANAVVAVSSFFFSPLLRQLKPKHKTAVKNNNNNERNPDSFTKAKEKKRHMSRSPTYTHKRVQLLMLLLFTSTRIRLTWRLLQPGSQPRETVSPPRRSQVARVLPLLQLV